jgi:hypothetical protein
MWHSALNTKLNMIRGIAYNLSTPQTKAYFDVRFR